MCWAWSGLVLLSCTSTLKLAAVGTRTAVPGGGGRGMTSLHNEDTHGNLMVSHCLAPHTELTCTMKQQGNHGCCHNTTNTQPTHHRQHRPRKHATEQST